MKLDAMALCDLMSNQRRPREAAEQFVGDVYRRHTPHGWQQA